MTHPKSASTAVPVHPLVSERWSPRGFDRMYELRDDEVLALLEAARWAPSANNSQPWRFLLARRGDEAFTRLFATLAPGNQAWAGAASALLLVAAQTSDETGQPRRWALYDTGQAVAFLAAQAQAQGLALHQMGGFDPASAREEFQLAPDLAPVVVVAVGRADADADLPEPLAARERAPRTRQPLDTLLLPVPPSERQQPAA